MTECLTDIHFVLNRHLDIQLLLTPFDICISFTELPVTENTVIAVGFFALSRVQAEKSAFLV